MTQFSFADQFMVRLRQGLAEGQFDHLRRRLLAQQPDPALSADRERLYDGKR